MKVREVMTRKVIYVRDDAPFLEVVDVMSRNRVSGLPVVDANGRVVGIVTEADLLSKEGVAEAASAVAKGFIADEPDIRDVAWLERARGLLARDVMTKDVEMVDADDEVDAVARRTLRRRVRRFPVVEDGRLVGIVARHDLLGVFQRDDRDIEAQANAILSGYIFVAPGQDVRASVHLGVVTLSGTVLYELDSRMAEQLIVGISGVVGVRNELRYLDAPNPLAAQSEQRPA